MVQNDPVAVTALAAAKASYPTAGCHPIWIDRSGGQAGAILEVAFEDQTFHHQISCLLDGEVWVAWTESLAPGWLQIDEPFGVMTRARRVEVGTAMVRLEHLGEERDVAPA